MRIDKIVEMLTRHEGLRLKVYKCPSGKLTIGIGRNLEDKGITQEEALYLLYNDIDDCFEQLQKHIPFWLSLGEKNKIVLLDMCFQMGIGGLLGFREFLCQLGRGDYLKAAEAMLDSKWAREDSPKRAKELAEIIKNA